MGGVGERLRRQGATEGPGGWFIGSGFGPLERGTVTVAWAAPSLAWVRSARSYGVCQDALNLPGPTP